MDEDIYLKKIVVFKHGEETLQFRVSQGLFSSFQVDIGTRFLLRTIAASNSSSLYRILDLGCGYGPIGLTLKKINNESTVHMVDRDALAVEYSRQNAALNQLSDVNIYGSLGYDDVQETNFDLIISNIPGKASQSVISHLLRDAAHYLRPEGLVAIVVVTPLKSTVEKILASTPNIDIIFHKTRSGHTVFHYRFTNDSTRTDYSRENALERGVYNRNRAVFTFHNLDYRMQTAHGLPEFDSLDYRTEFLMEAIRVIRMSSVRRAIMFNPGQGHVPVVLWKLAEPNSIVLVDRDLLSLRYSKKNLALNKCPDGRITLSHQVGILTKDEEQTDVIIGVLREDEGPKAIARTIEQAAAQLSPDGILMVSAGSTAITRLIDVVQSQNLLRVEDRKRRKGCSLLILKPSS